MYVYVLDGEREGGYVMEYDEFYIGIDYVNFYLSIFIIIIIITITIFIITIIINVLSLPWFGVVQQYVWVRFQNNNILHRSNPYLEGIVHYLHNIIPNLTSFYLIMLNVKGSFKKYVTQKLHILWTHPPLVTQHFSIVL